MQRFSCCSPSSSTTGGAALAAGAHTHGGLLPGHPTHGGPRRLHPPGEVDPPRAEDPPGEVDPHHPHPGTVYILFHFGRYILPIVQCSTFSRLPPVKSPVQTLHSLQSFNFGKLDRVEQL